MSPHLGLFLALQWVSEPSLGERRWWGRRGGGPWRWWHGAAEIVPAKRLSTLPGQCLMGGGLRASPAELLEFPNVLLLYSEPAFCACYCLPLPFLITGTDPVSIYPLIPSGHRLPKSPVLGWVQAELPTRGKHPNCQPQLSSPCALPRHRLNELSRLGSTAGPKNNCSEAPRALPTLPEISWPYRAKLIPGRSRGPGTAVEWDA